MIARLVPHPRLVVLLTIGFALLGRDLGPGSWVLGLLAALVTARLTAPFWPDRPPLRRAALTPRYVARVIADIVRSTLTVAWIILTWRAERLRPAFVALPLELASPEARALLAATVTLTPGTLSADFSADGRVLLVHLLHAPSPDAAAAPIKARYERLLARMFG